MALTTYLTVNGTIYSQKKSGARTHFIHDALGSIAATINDGGSVVNKYTYKPYGELLSKTGVGEDPRFLWVGGTGYRTTGRRWAEKYVRRRHYGEQQGMWTTVDPLWPEESAYGYVGGNPVNYVDPSGTSAIRQLMGLQIRTVPNSNAKYVSIGCNEDELIEINDAIRSICYGNRAQKVDNCFSGRCGQDQDYRDCMQNVCKGISILRISCKWGSCCKQNDCACTENNVIYFCKGGDPVYGAQLPGCGAFQCVLAHEILHTCGFFHFGESALSKSRSEATWQPCSRYEDCLCSTCLEELMGPCNAMYRLKGNAYTKFDCDKFLNDPPCSIGVNHV